ncbi:hypothetical protein [Nocardia goodfellowii]|uniref:Uncharacterized protein n=1 Tax=Nocardia goodfellowii TaxID=882446 RepID=A0ABS4QTM3_9NOCA|nr:hypothetical protein [Nocardia goodfellowii]MBP2194540.1 hypothetical protein [Nocardia goodfellowii]
MTPDGAVERVLHSDEATLRLLRVLAHRMTHDPPQDSTARFHHSKYLPPIHDLWQAYHEADSGRLVPPPPVEQTAAAAPPPAGRATAHKEATALVLSSPRSLREVLTTLADQARSGELARGEHAGTVAAARDLLQALIANRILHL